MGLTFIIPLNIVAVAVAVVHSKNGALTVSFEQFVLMDASVDTM